MKALDIHRLLEEKEPMIQRMALKITFNAEKAKDLAQDAMLKVLLNPDKIVNQTNLNGLLYTILKNTYINAVKRSNRMQPVDEETMKIKTYKRSTSHVHESPELKFAGKEVKKTIESLKEDYRQPLQLFLDGYKYREIADKYGMPIGTVKTNIHLARKKVISMVQDPVAA